MADVRSIDGSRWQAALEHYDWDRLDAAMLQIEGRGVGEGGGLLRWYRLIEAEAITRRRSRVERLNDWLTLEYVPDQLVGLRDPVVERALAACDQIAARFAWRHSVATWLAILAEEADGPWATCPYGYCVHKEPYEKICLPNYLADDLDEFQEAVAHEYAHVIGDDLSGGHAPRWLEEAIAVLAERRLDPTAWQAFREDAVTWLRPADLEWTLENPDGEASDDEVWRAYQQCGWLGRYLVGLRGEERLVAMLREHANESVGRNLVQALTGRSRCEAALRATYGLSAQALFDRAADWLRSQPSPE